MRLLPIILLLGFLSVQCASHQSENRERIRIENEYKIPRFSTQESQDLAFEIALFLDDLKKSIQKGEEINLSELQQKVLNFKEKNQSLGQSVTIQDTQKLMTWFMEVLQNNFAEHLNFEF